MHLFCDKARAGRTTGVLTHDFASKEELLSEALRVTFQEVIGKALADTQDDSRDVYELLRRWLPCFPGRLTGWQAWIAVVGSAQFSAANRALHEEYYRRLTDEAKRRLNGVPLAMEVGVAADLTLAFLDGLCTRVIMEPHAWPPERQEALLAAFTASVLRERDA